MWSFPFAHSVFSPRQGIRDRSPVLLRKDRVGVHTGLFWAVRDSCPCPPLPAQARCSRSPGCVSTSRPAQLQAPARTHSSKDATSLTHQSFLLAPRTVLLSTGVSYSWLSALCTPTLGTTHTPGLGLPHSMAKLSGGQPATDLGRFPPGSHWVLPSASGV